MAVCNLQTCLPAALQHKAGKLELLGRNADEQVHLATVLGVLKDFFVNYVRLVYGQYN